MKFKSFSSKITKNFATIFSRELLKRRVRFANHALVVGLSGDLGSGKTTFAQGFARGLGLKKKLVSPTFLIMKSYNLRGKRFKKFFHTDVYRLQKKKELKTIDFQKVVGNPKNIILVEWADKIKKTLPKRTFWLILEHGRRANERLIFIEKQK